MAKKQDKPINLGKKEEEKKNEADEPLEDQEYDKWGKETIQYLLQQIVDKQNEKQERGDQLTV